MNNDHSGPVSEVHITSTSLSACPQIHIWFCCTYPAYIHISPMRCSFLHAIILLTGNSSNFDNTLTHFKSKSRLPLQSQVRKVTKHSIPSLAPDLFLFLLACTYLTTSAYTIYNDNSGLFSELRIISNGLSSCHQNRMWFQQVFAFQPNFAPLFFP